MSVSTPEVLAEKLFERLQAPAGDTPEALKSLLSTIQNSDKKPDILARVREKLQGLSAEQQQQVDVNLQQLETRLEDFQEGIALLKEVSRLRGELQELSSTLPPATTVTEWLQREMSDVRTDFMEGSLLKKAGYLTGAYVGYRLVQGLWSKIRSVFTSSEKKGFFGKLVDVGATAVGAVAGVVGASQLLKAFGGSKTTNEALFRSTIGPDGKPVLRGFFDRDQDSVLPDAIENVVEPVAEGTYRGLEEAKTFFGPAFDALSQHEHVRDVIEHREDYDSNAAFVQAIVTAALADGLHFAFDGTTGFLSAGGELISLTGEFWTILGGGLVDGEIDTGDLLSVYVEGFVLYATSLTALKYLTFKRVGGNANVLFEAGMWPVYVVKRTFSASTKTVSFAYELSSATSSTRLGFERRMGALTQRRLNVGRFAGVSDEGLQLRHAFAMDQMRLLEKARAASGIDPDALRLFEIQEAKAVEHFQKYLRAFAKKNPVLPDWFLRAQELSSAKGIAPDLMSSAHLRDILSRAAPTSIPDPVVPTPTATVPRTAPAVSPESMPAGTQAAEEVVTSANPHGTPTAEPLPHSGVPHEASVTPSSPGTQPPLRRAAGDGVVPPSPQPATAPLPDGAPAWRPRVVRPDGSVVDGVTGEVLELVETTPHTSATPTTDVPEETPARTPSSQTDDLLRQAEIAAEEWNAGVRVLRQDILGLNAAPDVIQAFDGAVDRCRTYGLTLADTGILLKDAPSLACLSGQVRGVTPELLESTLRVAVDGGGVQAVRRVSRYVVSLGSGATETLLDSTIIRTISELSDFHPQAVSRFFGKLASQNLLTGVTPEQLAETIRGLSRWQKAGNLARGLHIGFAALDAAFLTMDVVSLVEMRRRHAETIASMESSLTKAGFRQQGNRWVHAETGASVELRQLQDSVSSLSNPQSARVAADIGGLPLLLPCVSFGPAGLAIGITLIVVHTGVSTWEQSKNRAFLEHTPTPILAALTTQGTVGQDPSDIVADMSTWMISDVLHPFSDFNEEQKRLIRTKMMALMLAQELSELEQSHPGITSLVTGGKDITTFLDERSDLLSGDFDAVLKPFIAARLFQRSNDGTVTWENFRDLKVDDGVFDFENVDGTDMRIIMREAIFLYTKHVVQREYQRQSASLRERGAVREQSSQGSLEHLYQFRQTAEISEEDEAERNRLEELGRETVFGTAMSALPEERTMIETMMRSLTEKFDAVDREATARYNGPYSRGESDLHIESATRDLMLQQEPNLFSLGLPEELQSGLSPSVVGLARLPSESRVRENADPAESLRILLPAATRTFEQTKNVAWAGLGPWQAQEANYTVLADYASLLAEHASLDPTGLRQKIIALGSAWNWSAAHPGSEFMGRRNDAFHGVVADLAIHLSYLHSRITPLDPATLYVNEAYYEREMTLLAVHNAPSIIIGPSLGASEGTRTFTGVAGKTTSFDAAPYGNIRCVSEVATNGRTSYEWTFTPRNAEAVGMSFVVSATVDDDVHAQHERAIAALHLRRNVTSTGAVRYTREGYAGEYLLQSDGTVFYTGQDEANGTPVNPATFVLPSAELRQDYFHRQVTLPEGRWLPIRDPLPDTVRAAERVEIKRMQDLVFNVKSRQEGASIYFPANGWMNIKLTLIDGTVVEGRYSRELVGKITPYLSIRRARVNGYRRYQFDGTSWSREETAPEDPVSCMIFTTTAAGSANIAGIEFSDYDTTSRGFKHVYRFPASQSRSETPPALTSN